MSLKSILRSVIVSVTVYVTLTFASKAFAGTTTYVYDELDRLKYAIYVDGTVIEYDYDELGNRTQLNTYANADFSASPVTGYFPLSVNFTDLTTNSPTAWHWDFGDGVTSASRNPSHAYTNQGTYTVSLNVTNSLGTYTKTKTSYITVQAGTTYPVKIASATPTYYSSLQAAYNAAADGSTIQCQAVSLTENVSFNANKSVTIAGGYSADYTSSTGVTTIHGAMTISAGNVTARSISMPPQ
ncbi:MAG TPA: PKD domain-containing protein [Geobacteraceae bacterium]